MSSDTANDVKRFLKVAAKELSNKRTESMGSNQTQSDEENYESPVPPTLDRSLQISLVTPPTTVPSSVTPSQNDSLIKGSTPRNAATAMGREQVKLDTKSYPKFVEDDNTESQYEVPRDITVNSSTRTQLDGTTDSSKNYNDTHLHLANYYSHSNKTNSLFTSQYKKSPNKNGPVHNC